MTPRTQPHLAHWGAFSVTVEDDRITDVSGHRDDADPSPLLDNFLDAIQGPARVARPAVRRGWLEQGPGPDERRGDDDFVEVSWAEALDLVAGELARVRAEHGNESIFGGSYGWASAGRFHHAQSQLHRFLNCIGGYTFSVGSYSLGGSEVLLPHVVGGSNEVLRRATTWKAILAHTDLVVAFGGMNIKNAYVSPGGVTRHTLRPALDAAAARGLDFTLFSPLRSDLPEPLAATWQPVRPGTDTAVMLGLAHVLVSEGLHDTAFLETYTVGADRLIAYVLGESDGVAKTPEWASAISGVAAEDLRTLARRMAASRTLVTVSWALQRTEHGESNTPRLPDAFVRRIALPRTGRGRERVARALRLALQRPLPGHPPDRGQPERRGRRPAHQGLLDVEAGEPGLAELIPGRDAIAPRLTRVSVSPRQFAAIRRGGKPRHAREGRPARGSKLRLITSERVTLAVRVERNVRGRWRRVQSFERNLAAGRRAVRFGARVKSGRRTRALAAGRYRFSMQAADDAGNRSPRLFREFRLVTGKRPVARADSASVGLFLSDPGQGHSGGTLLPLARTFIAVACIAGLPAAAAAGAQKGKFATSHVIKTPAGSQRGRAGHSELQARRQGSELEAVPAHHSRRRPRQAARRPGTAGSGEADRARQGTREVRAPPVLLRQRYQGAAQCARRRAADQGDRGVIAERRPGRRRQGQRPRSARKSKQTLARPTAEKSPAAVAHQEGENPCGVLGLSSATCTNVTGPVWTATHFWDAADTAITCPSGFPFATGSVSTKTSSPRYAQSVIVAEARPTGRRWSSSKTTTCAVTRSPTRRRLPAPPRTCTSRWTKRVSVITLGVEDVARSRAFYTALGWEPALEPDGRVIFFQAAGAVFALWAREDMEAETGVSGGRPGGLMLAYNTPRRRQGG